MNDPWYTGHSFGVIDMKFCGRFLVLYTRMHGQSDFGYANGQGTSEALSPAQPLAICMGMTFDISQTSFD